MPSYLNEKEERQYKHIKKTYLDRGKSEEEAEEIAARTVNKERREEGKTENTQTQGTGNPNLPYEERTKDELVNLAKQRGIKGADDMLKNELIGELRAD